MQDEHVAVPTPAGFTSFCLRFPDQCRVQLGLPQTVSLTRENWRTIDEVNRAVNQSIWASSDLQHYGRAEYWTIPTDGYGDCDDYAVTKRAQLLAMSFPVAALRLAVADTPHNGRHAVLTVSTDRGDFVLDNLRDDIVSWNATGYRWVERQSPENPWAWLLQSPNAPMVAEGQPTVAAMAPGRR
jgi:predicted transglutaminase-like cysteine proteinase